jgi:hypothetical protein
VIYNPAWDIMDIRFKRNVLEKLSWQNNIKHPPTFSDILHFGMQTRATNDRHLVFDWVKELITTELITPVLDLKYAADDYYIITFKGLWNLHTLDCEAHNGPY